MKPKLLLLLIFAQCVIIAALAQPTIPSANYDLDGKFSGTPVSSINVNFSALGAAECPVSTTNIQEILGVGYFKFETASRKYISTDATNTVVFLNKATLNQAPAYIYLPTMSNGVGTISLDARTTSTSNSRNIGVEYSLNGGAWTTLTGKENILVPISTAENPPAPLVYNMAGNIQLRFAYTSPGSSGSIWIAVKSIQITNYITSTPLTTPTVGTASAIGADGFTANWTAVSNASGYDVQVYLGSGLVKTQNFSGQSTAGGAISGLLSGVTYTYRVVAKGDGTIYTDSEISPASSAVETTDPTATSAINTNFNDGSWGATGSYLSGNYPTNTINGFILNKAGLFSGTRYGSKGEEHINFMGLDNSTQGGSITLPTINALEQIEIHAYTFTANRSFKLKELNRTTGVWEDVTTFTYVPTFGTYGLDSVYIFNVSRSQPTKFRIDNNGGGTMVITQIITRRTAPTSLSSPTASTPANISNTSVRAAWSLVENATGYIVRVFQANNVRASAVIDNPATFQADITGLVPNTPYFYRVSAVGNGSTLLDSYLSPSGGSFTTLNMFTVSANTDISNLATLNTSSEITVSGYNTQLTANTAKSVAKLTMGAGTKLNLSNIGLELNDFILKVSKTDAPSVTASNGMTISGNLSLHRTIDNAKWHFISMPSDVSISAITKVSGAEALLYGTNWIIKYYDGASRVVNLGAQSNWKDMASDGILLANKGYIIRMANGTSGDYELAFPLDKALLTVAETAERTVSVTAHGEGEVAANHVGWNLVGVPYMSNYAGSGVGAEYLTFHNGTTYTQSAKVDVLNIQPYKAFFIQASAAGTTANLSFANNSRQATPSLAATRQTTRIALNITTAGGVDKTHLIMDDNQSTDYVINQDLEKWLTTGTDYPQIYSVLNNVKYAYNGLPVTDVNRLALGVYCKKEGMATISATASDLQNISAVLLTDKVTNQITNLLVDDYSYNATAGTDESRFEIILQKISTGNIRVNSGNVVYVLEDSQLRISNLQGRSLVRVFDIQGKLLINKTLSGESFETTVPQASMLIVQILSGENVYITKVSNHK